MTKKMIDELHALELEMVGTKGAKAAVSAVEEMKPRKLTKRKCFACISEMCLMDRFKKMRVEKL